MLGGLLADEYGIMPAAEVYWDDQRREGNKVTPVIKVYPISSPARAKGIGYTHRRVEHRLSVDVSAMDDQVAWDAKEEVIRILGKHRVAPFPGYDLLEYDDGTPRPGYGGYYRYVIEVTMTQCRKKVRE
jgi:hypothetical protein